MQEQRNDSEILFEQYLDENGYHFDHHPEIAGKNKKMDNRVFFEGTEVFFEVKEFREGISIPKDGAYDPYERIHAKLEESREQLNEYSEYSCSLVLYNGSAAPVVLEPQFVLGAMLGPWSYFVDNDSKEAHPFFGVGDPEGYRAGYMIDYEEKLPRNTPFSSIIVLEKFPLGEVKFSELYDQRAKRREKNDISEVNAVDTYDYLQSLAANGFDVGEIVLRVVVYENPFAAIHPASAASATSASVAPEAISRSPSSATHWPAYSDLWAAIQRRLGSGSGTGIGDGFDFFCPDAVPFAGFIASDASRLNSFARSGAESCPMYPRIVSTVILAI